MLSSNSEEIFILRYSVVGIVVGGVAEAGSSQNLAFGDYVGKDGRKVCKIEYLFISCQHFFLRLFLITSCTRVYP